MTVGSGWRKIAVHDVSYDWPGARAAGTSALHAAALDGALSPPQVRITLYFGDRRSAGPYVVSVPADGALEAHVDVLAARLPPERERANDIAWELSLRPPDPSFRVARAG